LALERVSQSQDAQGKPKGSSMSLVKLIELLLCHEEPDERGMNGQYEKKKIPP
jgi:hypothetical protein